MERKGTPLSVNVAFNEAKRIFNEMYDLKIPAPDGRFFWGYTNSINLGFSFSDHSLYNGFTGMAIFASALASVCDDEHIKEVADYLVNETVNETHLLLESLKDSESPDSVAPIGEASGLDGVLKGLELIKRYMPDKKLDDLCGEILDVLDKTDFEKYLKADMITGVAGIISTFCRFDEYKGYKKIIRAAADRLLERKNFEYHGFTLWKTLSETPRIISGRGHGMAGIAQALFAAAEILNDDKYIQAANEALDYEITLYKQYADKVGSWPDMRDFPPKTYVHGNCYGAPGIGIVLNRIRKAGCEAVETLKGFARDRVDKLPLNVCDHLCCGNSAIVEYYLTTGDYNSAGDVLSAMYERRQKEGSYRYRSYDQNNGVTASLFYGLCGIGYEMLRYVYPNKFISIL